MDNYRPLKFANIALWLMIVIMMIPSSVYEFTRIRDNNICVFPDYPPAPDYSALTPSYATSDPDLVIAGDPSAITAEGITVSDLADIDDSDGLKILIIPTGFTDEEIRALQPIVDRSEQVMDQYGLEVDYVYLRHSLPVPVYHYGDIAEIRDFQPLDQLRLDLHDSYAAHTIAVFANTEGLRSVYYNPGLILYAINDPSATYYPLIHETGHVLGLNDGYFRQYSASDIILGRNTELSISRGGDRQVQRYFNCLGLKVYSTPDEMESVMISRYSDIHIDSTFAPPPLFTEAQVEIMLKSLERIKK